MDDRRLIFAKEYVASGNATTASIRAGYKKSNAANTGCRLLKDEDIRKEIERLRAKSVSVADSRRILTVQEIKERLTIEALRPENAESVRVRALELLGKASALFVDKTESVQDITLDHVSTESLLKLLASE